MLFRSTNASTKPKMLNEVKERILSGALRALDEWTYKELRSFQVDDRGMPYCPRNGSMGHHGDSVIALALAIQCLDKVQVDWRPYLPDWIRHRKVQNIREYNSGKEHRRY